MSDRVTMMRFNGELEIFSLNPIPDLELLPFDILIFNKNKFLLLKDYHLSRYLDPRFYDKLQHPPFPSEKAGFWRFDDREDCEGCGDLDGLLCLPVCEGFEGFEGFEDCEGCGDLDVLLCLPRNDSSLCFSKTS
jgi:hypothetical protein